MIGRGEVAIMFQNPAGVVGVATGFFGGRRGRLARGGGVALIPAERWGDFCCRTGGRGRIFHPPMGKRPGGVPDRSPTCMMRSR